MGKNRTKRKQKMKKKIKNGKITQTFIWSNKKCNTDGNGYRTRIFNNVMLANLNMLISCKRSERSYKIAYFIEFEFCEDAVRNLHFVCVCVCQRWHEKKIHQQERNEHGSWIYIWCFFCMHVPCVAGRIQRRAHAFICPSSSSCWTDR